MHAYGICQTNSFLRSQTFDVWPNPFDSVQWCHLGIRLPAEVSAGLDRTPASLQLSHEWSILSHMPIRRSRNSGFQFFNALTFVHSCVLNQVSHDATATSDVNAVAGTGCSHRKEPRNDQGEKKMKKKLALSFGVAVLSTAGMLGAAGVASADTSGDSGALATYLTLYGNDDMGGNHKGFASGNSDSDLGNNFWTGTSHVMEDEASSMINNTGRDVGLFQKGGSSCGGDVYVALRHTRDADFSNNNFDNKTSCVDFR